MKKLLLFILPLALIACGGGEDEKKGGTLDLSEYGLDATIEAGEYSKVKARDLKTNYPLTLSEKSIEIEYDNGMLIIIQQSKDNDVKRALEFAESFDDKVLESSDNHYLIQTEKQGEQVYNCSFFYETDGGVIEVRIADEKLFLYAKTEEQIKKGTEIAKSFKFK